MNHDATALPLARKPGRPKKTERKFDLVELYKLRVLNGLSYGELARHFNLSKSSVHAALERLNKYLPDPEQTKAFEEVEPQLLTAVKERLLRSLMDEGKIEKASLNNAAFAFSQIFNAHRLRVGASTENLSLLSRVITEANANPFEQDKSERA